MKFSVTNKVVFETLLPYLQPPIRFFIHKQGSLLNEMKSTATFIYHINWSQLFSGIFHHFSQNLGFFLTFVYDWRFHCCQTVSNAKSNIFHVVQQRPWCNLSVKWRQKEYFLPYLDIFSLFGAVCGGLQGLRQQREI